MGKLPIISTVKHAYRFGFCHWRPVWGVLLLLAVSSAFTSLEANEQLIGIRLLAAVLYMAATIMAMGALYRIALPNEAEPPPGPAGFQWRRLEWRLLWASLLMLGALVGACLAVALAAALLWVGVRAATGVGEASPEARLLGLVLLVLIVWLLVYVVLRLSLIMADTARRQKVSLKSAWAITRGQTLRLLAIGLLATLPTLLLLSILVGVGTYLLVLNGAAEATSWAFEVGLGLVVGVAEAFLIIPLSVGYQAAAYDFLQAGAPSGEPIPT